MKNEMTEKQVLWMKTAVAALFVLIAAALRILPHPLNLTPIGAMALFGGFAFKERWLKIAFPFAALFVSDTFIGFHQLMIVVYASFLVNVIIGMWLEKHRGIVPLAGGTLLGAVQFFLVTNFAVWAAFATYPKSFAGLIACYAAGVPFFWNTLAGDALYVALFFGGYALAERWLRQPNELSQVQR